MSGGGGGVFGKGGGSSTTTVNSPAANTLASLASQFASETTGARTGLIDAMEEVLQTGGSSIPIISRSVEATRRAGSKSLADTEENLARTGLAGTPFGESIRAGTMQEGEIAAGQTEQSLATAIFNMIPNLILGQSQTALSGLSGAIPGMNTTNSKEKALATSQYGGGGFNYKG